MSSGSSFFPQRQSYCQNWVDFVYHNHALMAMLGIVLFPCTRESFPAVILFEKKSCFSPIIHLSAKKEEDPFAKQTDRQIDSHTIRFSPDIT